VALPPILLLVVPYISLGEHQRAAFEAFLARMFAAGQLPRRGHVCFVRRAAHGHQGTTNLSLGTLELITFVLCVLSQFSHLRFLSLCTISQLRCPHGLYDIVQSAMSLYFLYTRNRPPPARAAVR